jgi:DNA polymerase
MDKAARMQAIETEIRELTSSPLYDYRVENDYEPVIGEGDLDAHIMFIGEAPGAQEAKTGRPFVGSAGHILEELLSSIGVDREDVYITNVVKDRPPNNRDPHVEEIELYTPLFDMSEAGAKVGDLHGQVLKAQHDGERLAVVPLYHPAAAFYNRELESTLEEDIRHLEPFVTDI